MTWCESKRGRDFFAWREPVDWIITNPPWSQFRAFLQLAMSLSRHVVFLVTINHLWTRARIRDIRTAGFGIREIVMVDMPASFPPLGFQLGAVHLQRGWTGPIALTDWVSGATPDSGDRIPETGGRKADVGFHSPNFNLQSPNSVLRLPSSDARPTTRRARRTPLHLIPELLRKHPRK